MAAISKLIKTVNYAETEAAEFRSTAVRELVNMCIMTMFSN